MFHWLENKKMNMILKVCEVLVINLQVKDKWEYIKAIYYLKVA